MSSQDKTIVRLQSTVSKEKFEFKLSDTVKPSLALKLNKRDSLISKYADLVADLKEGEKAPTEAAEIMNKIIDSGLDALCIILEIESIPEGYDNKRDLLADCLESLQVVNVIIEVFYKAMSDSTASLVASDLKARAEKAVEVIRQ